MSVGPPALHQIGLARTDRLSIHSGRSWVVVPAMLAASTTHIPCRGAPGPQRTTRRFPSSRRVSVFLCLQVYHGTMAARPRRKRVAFLAATAVLFSLWMQPACRPPPHLAVEQAPVDSGSGGFPVPQQVRRLAVWYPRPWDQDVAYGYRRLEQAAFQLKTQRSWIKI